MKFRMNEKMSENNQLPVRRYVFRCYVIETRKCRKLGEKFSIEDVHRKDDDQDRIDEKKDGMYTP